MSTFNWIWGFLLLAACARGQPLSTAVQVTRLSMAQARSQQRVVLRGIVTQVIPEWWGFTLQDATDGVYVMPGDPFPAGLREGQYVEVAGRTADGNFAPGVKADSVRVLSSGRIPQPRPASWRKLSTGSCDNDYVEVRAVVRSVRSVEPPAWQWRATALRLDLGGNLIWAYLRAGQTAPEPLVDSTVRVRGVCLVLANSRTQFQGTALSIAQAGDIHILRPGIQDPFQAPLEPLKQLFSYKPGAVSFHQVRVEGTVTLQSPGFVVIQDKGEGLLVHTRSGVRVRPGDRVEAVGFPVAGAYSASLEDGLIRVRGPGTEPAPVEMPAGRVLARSANSPAAPGGLLVRVAGRVLEQTRSASEEWLVLADGDTSFSARLRASGAGLGRLEPGTRIELTGVCLIQVNELGLPRGFELLLRSPADLRVLQRPPWFSRAVAMRLAEALFAFLIVALAGLALLRRQVRRQTRTIRRQVEREAALEQRYRNLVENASDLVYVRDLEGVLLQVNVGAEEMTGYSREELVGHNIVEFLAPVERERAREKLAQPPDLEKLHAAEEWRFLMKNGCEITVETKQRFLFENGRPVCVECIGRDVTARKRAQAEAINERNRLEEQLHHSQKLESVGQLAGGVAHDFNNLLTVMGGYAQMVLGELPKDSPSREAIHEIAQAADRASALIRQLLLFSRRQAPQPAVISLNELVRHLEKMLRRLIGEDIQLDLLLEAGRDLIQADPGYIEQAIVNLAVNARDAMPEGGRLTIRTREIRQGGKSSVSLEVADTGVGIGPEVRARIFEPFFTTKPQGKGTGLGLSIVQSIVKQVGGAISVDSEPGRGTSFQLTFPGATASAAAGGDAATTVSPASSGETILVAEDETGVRKLVSAILSSHGYKVLEAANGREALEESARYGGTIHMLLTDVIMPEMGGAALAERFLELRPGVPVLHMSGFMDRVPAAARAWNILEKPFTAQVLLARVGECLRASGRGTRAGDGRS